MAKIQPCRNGCGQLITVGEHEGRWKPFNVSEDGTVQALHDCPNSTWNKNKAAQQPQPTTSWTGTTKGGQMFEAKVSQGLQMAQTSLNEVILKMLTDISQKQTALNEKQQTESQKLEAVANNVLEILGLLQDQFIKEHGPQTTASSQEELKDLTDEEIKKIADTERIDEAPKKHDGSDYGF
jgi:hypothetical protein